jgi:hypothetical protein
MAPADKDLAAVKGLAAQAGTGTSARELLVASGAVPTLLKHLSSKTAAVVSQSALALSLLAADPTTRPSLWEHRRALVPALVQTLKNGGPLTLTRSLATLAALIKHIPKAGAAVIKANGILPILRIAQADPQDPRDAAVAAMDAFRLQREGGNSMRPAETSITRALGHALDLVDPLIRTLSAGSAPPRAKLFALRVLRRIPEGPRVLQALRRPMVTDTLVGFAAAEDVEIASASLEVLMSAFGNRHFHNEITHEDTVYWDSPALRNFWETLSSSLQSPHNSLVEAALLYLKLICITPGLCALPWFHQCVRDIPRLLQSPLHTTKVRALFFAHRAWLARYAIPWPPLSPWLCLQLSASVLADE